MKIQEKSTFVQNLILKNVLCLVST